VDFSAVLRNRRGVDPRSADHLAFGRAIRELREEQGISQEELSHRSGLDRSYTGAVERGERNVSLTNILRISAGLDVTPTALFERFEQLTRR
jgi:transcriptional regulator with XRE-family HTH domain